MVKAIDDGILLQNQMWQRERLAIALLSSLNYRTGELSGYLFNIACGVSQLLNVDWSVVTLCQQGFEKVLASSINIGVGEHVYSLHGSLTNTVIETGNSLVVEDTSKHPEYGQPPEGYRAYLGIPLRTAEGEVIGTICSFHHESREFSPEEIQFTELLAERAATAIDNYRLYKQQCQFNHILEAEVEKRTAELKATQSKLLEKERLAVMGEFAAMIVHEIRNPLTTMIMGLKYSQKTILSSAAQERLSLAVSEAYRLDNLLSEILLYAKPQILQICELEVNKFISELLVLVYEMPEAISRKIEFIPSSNPVKILADENKLKQVFINIICNACEVIADGDIVKWEVDVSLPDQVCINICNGGEPIPPEILSKLTQPFFSTKPHGTGLGLAIAERIIHAHYGKLSIESDIAKGTIVSVRLPIATFKRLGHFEVCKDNL
ncbi:GAF domain-containing protein [Anabaena sp. FACHB-709]|uniref:histidine kinase n=2 Tax=Nostocaceae TaxID=1162 RepID=A0A1Z4KTA0_ANAVA|nr:MULTISPECIES: GAF domain-containing protein [Nostocaceae]BAY72164.1 two-component sensor histidine kinase [Trichormus variabilis NIES-23]HBW28883.1 ATPase [Nostoc sp. UBA8866]MBD2171401.1 GAF domain-containing protein [Anabaena cylindrica FACHB-318]MBD2263183.1 GAF domain-containing protein [Anabaena sp. FACHB-709]MBD2272729.1 GAF domain-containing protein [Nostoc sp. PCC 7120 = FACHB-418]